MDEKKHPGVQELDDSELGEVSGGITETTYNGRKYKWNGGTLTYDSTWDKAFLCPRCGRPVHYGILNRYYCDACDESWYYESKLVPNLAGGLWEEK